MMRQAGHDRHGLRVRALVAVLWRGGLRISEALALNETDIDARRGSLLIRHGKGDKRREAGMDQFGFEQLAAWLAHREIIAARTPVVRHRRVNPRPPLVSDRRPSRTTPARGRRRGQAAVRSAPAASRACRRARARRSSDQHHPAPARTYRPGDHQHVSARNRSQRDHRRRPLPPPADHLRHRRTDPLTAEALQIAARRPGGRPAPPLPLRPGRARAGARAALPERRRCRSQPIAF